MKKLLMFFCAVTVIVVLGSHQPAPALYVPYIETGNDRLSAISVDPYFSLDLLGGIIFTSSPDPTGDILPTATVVGFIGEDPPNYNNQSANSTGNANDVDWYMFTGTLGATVFFDVDNADIPSDLDVDNDVDNADIPSVLDVQLFLFNGVGTLLAGNDDSALDPGSASLWDPFIGEYQLPDDGTYYVAISSYDNDPTSAATGSAAPLTRPDGQSGGSAISGRR